MNAPKRAIRETKASSRLPRGQPRSKQAVTAENADHHAPVRPAAGSLSEYDALAAELRGLREELVSAESRYRKRLARIHPNHALSVANLLHYVRLRRHDLRPLQKRLAELGLSSLGRSESRVIPTLDAILEMLERLDGGSALPRSGPMDFALAQHLQEEHEQLLLGSRPAERQVRIMVTLPTLAAEDPNLTQQLVAAGTDCFRINCAHDEEGAWKRMVRHVREAATAQHRPCRILMDLAGPKLRTGPVQPGPEVLQWRPSRNALGHPLGPARVWLVPEGRSAKVPAPSGPVVPLEAKWLDQVQPGDSLRLLDTRGRSRRLRVTRAEGGCCLVESNRSAYVVPGTPIWWERDGGPRLSMEGRVGSLPIHEQPLRLHVGDALVLTRSLEPGRPAEIGPDGTIAAPARIGCTLPEVFSAVRPGERILFDDGVMEGVVRSVHQDELLVDIKRTPVRGASLRGDKGINLPDTRLTLGALTSKDRQDLAFVVKHADMVGLSFVGSGRDVQALQTELSKRKGSELGIVLKIETKRAFEHLPRLLVTAMRNPAVGVMIARGDLAVECGYERLAEVQEQILWMCEAAHLPVIWATQVLESLAKDGRPSRAEITDAAMGVRAECVMLNKGPYIVDAVRMLDDILRRMQDHQQKKRTMLRKLHLALGLRGL